MTAIDPEVVAKNSWAVGFVIAGLQLTAPVLAGLVWLTVRAYRRGDTAIGLLLTAPLLVPGGGWSVGVPLGLILGWASARRWQARRFMAWWSALIVAACANFGLAVLMRKMSVEGWREWFGWLPTF